MDQSTPEPAEPAALVKQYTRKVASESGLPLAEFFRRARPFLPKGSEEPPSPVAWLVAAWRARDAGLPAPGERRASQGAR